MTLRIGVVGVGGIGRAHVRRIADRLAGARVVAVTDLDRERCAAVAASVGARTAPDAAALIVADEVDAVLVATPGPAHHDDVLACLAVGKPVFCEKPLATSSATARLIVEAERAGGLPLVSVGFMRRFDPAYLRMKAGLDGGGVGLPLLIHAAHRNPSVPSWYTRPMSILDTAVHEFDAVRWLLDDEVAQVRVDRPRPSSLSPDHIVDPMVIVATMRSGVRVDVEVFVTCQYGYEIRCEVVAERGVVDLVGSGGPARPSASYHDRFERAFEAELQAWIGAAAQRSGCGAGAWDGYAAACVCESAIRALEEGGTVAVDLPG